MNAKQLTTAQAARLAALRERCERATTATASNRAQDAFAAYQERLLAQGVALPTLLAACGY